jgi:hypothetical protein
VCLQDWSKLLVQLLTNKMIAVVVCRLASLPIVAASPLSRLCIELCRHFLCSFPGTSQSVGSELPLDFCIVSNFRQSQSLCSVDAWSFTLMKYILHLSHTGIDNAIERTINGVEREEIADLWSISQFTDLLYKPLWSLPLINIRTTTHHHHTPATPTTAKLPQH